MNVETPVIKIDNLVKTYKDFKLEIPDLSIPKGMATALIGENGAGKSTLLNILTGIRLDYEGKFEFFEGKYKEEMQKEKVGYVASSNYFIPSWTIKQVSEGCKILYKSFDPAKFDSWCKKLMIDGKEGSGKEKYVTKLSDGMQMKTMLASVFARDTECLVLDEPASPLDPLMRDYLCTMIREYLEEGAGEKSVFFSTHNIADMEAVTDYAIIMEKGNVVEQGFVEDLKEKYTVVKGDAADTEKASQFLFQINKSSMGFDGLILSENLDKLAGMNVITETPTLSQISVSVMKKYTSLGEE